MPTTIDHIDKIARDKNRDVLYLSFHSVPNTEDNKKKFNKEDVEIQLFNYPDELEVFEDSPNRKIILDWLNGNNLTFTLCSDFATTNGWCSYRGQIYLDFPVNSIEYQKFEEFFEERFRGWSDKFEGVRFCLCSLTHSLINKHHDEPGFWENWAENF